MKLLTETLNKAYHGGSFLQDLKFGFFIKFIVIDFFITHYYNGV